MLRINVVHRTEYHYARPVAYGEHRLMCRPRDSHDLRLIDTSLTISPPSAGVRWMHDVFGNSIAVATFQVEAKDLVFESSFTAEHYPAGVAAIEIEPYASIYPFHYTAEEVPDLTRTVERHYADPERKVDAWARAFLGGKNQVETMTLLMRINSAIRDEFTYVQRHAPGTQAPTETLEKKTGSCRDFALFMMEAVRSLGFAARFVSGYLYDEDLLGATAKVVGGGFTHAWVQVYLPGAGWIEFDPTNALVGGSNLVRVAVARDATQAVPLGGSFTGTTKDFLGMTVSVVVTAG